MIKDFSLIFKCCEQFGIRQDVLTDHENKKGKQGIEDRAEPCGHDFLRTVLTVLFAISVFGALSTTAIAASKAPVAIEDIQISPAAVTTGQYPDITARIVSSSKVRTEMTVVAALTEPDHTVKSWVWKKVSIAPGQKKLYPLPKEYDTKRAGVYKVEYVIYSADMRKRIQARSQTFTAAERAARPAEKKKEVKEREPAPERPQGPAFEIGAYANSLNPAGGATILIWPFRNVGLQGIYTVGEFTSYEGRLLVKLDGSSDLRPYVGIGYLHASKKANIIGVDTTFEDSKVSGTAGVEVLFSERLRGFVEVTGAGIKLEQDVTNGSQSAHATVKYAPVTIGLGLVWSVF